MLKRGQKALLSLRDIVALLGLNLLMWVGMAIFLWLYIYEYRVNGVVYVSSYAVLLIPIAIGGICSVLINCKHMSKEFVLFEKKSREYKGKLAALAVAQCILSLIMYLCYNFTTGSRLIHLLNKIGLQYPAANTTIGMVWSDFSSLIIPDPQTIFMLALGLGAYIFIQSAFDKKTVEG